MIDQILKIIKSPYFLIGLAVITSVVVYIIVSKPTPQAPVSTLGPKCPAPGVVLSCPDGSSQCGQNCPAGQNWDCTTKQCICPDGQKLCVNKTQCCGTCVNDVCCSGPNQISKNGVTSCCPPGTKPAYSQSGLNAPDICLAVCGDSTCNQGEECVKVSNLNADTYTKLINDPNMKLEIRSQDPTTNTITYCYGGPSCQFGDENALPIPSDDAYTYYNFENPAGYSKFSVCIPRSATDTSDDCSNNITSDECNNIPKCQWVTMPDNFDGNGPVGTQIKNYMLNKGKKEQGYYCDPGGLTLGRVSQFKQQGGSCSWKDCLTQISNQGTIDVNWDGTNCNAFKVPPYQNTGLQPVQQIQCTGKSTPCPSCNNNGDFVTAIKCTGPNAPCANCTSAGQIICVNDSTVCEPVSNNNSWTFNTCAPKAADGTVTQVFNSSGGGNCPWGCPNKSSSDQTCYSVDVPTGSGNVFGKPLDASSNDIVCLNDGQIWPEPTNPVKNYTYSPSQFICIESPISSTTSNYNNICACIRDIYTGKVPVSIANGLGSGFLIYQKTTDGVKWYMFYDNNNSVNGSGYYWFQYTNNIDDPRLTQGNLNFSADGSGTTLLNSYFFGVGYSNSKLQFCSVNGTSPAGKTNIRGMENSYSRALLQQIDNSKQLQYNTPYQFTYPSAGQDYGITTDIINSYENQTMVEYQNIAPESGNYVYFTRYAIEKQMKNNNC